LELKRAWHMTYLAAMPLENGDSLLIEVDEDAEGIVAAGRPGEIIATTAMTFEAALDRLRPAAQAIVAKLGSLSERPDEINVEFGIKLSTEAGLVIARASGEATFTVTLQWRRP
jgi:Trypsin-co-occurring domain 1